MSKRNNALIEKAANLSEYKRHERIPAKGDTDCKSTASDTASQVVMAKANTYVMRTSGYMSDPLAATM